MRTIDGRTDRRFRTDDVIVGGDGKIARSQHIDQFTAVEFKRYHGAIADLTLLGGGQDLRIAQFDGQLVDAALIYTLSLTSRLIAAVFTQIAFGTSRGDLGENFVTILAFTPSELFFHLVIGFLREQQRLFFGHIASSLTLEE